MGSEPEDDAWIEQVVKVAGALGFNAMRVRWKLMRWHEGRRKAARRREQWRDHVRYEHKTCGECGALQDKAELICTSCGARLTSRRIQVLQRLGLGAPGRGAMSIALAMAILAVYARVWIAGGGGLMAPPGWALDDFGAHGPSLTALEPWRLATAAFLHIGLWHLMFNLLAIGRIGPHVEAQYGGLTMLAVFLATAVLSGLGSEWMGTPGAAGASGGICGLIGAAAGAGHRQGTTTSRAMRNDMLMWLVYTLVVGVALHADNWAHVFGALLGLGFGYAVRPRSWQRPGLRPVRIVTGILGVAATIATLTIIFTRVPHPPPPLQDDVSSRLAPRYSPSSEGGPGS